MSDKEDYQACYDAFMAIPDADVKIPSMPVDKALQEAENLYQWCQEDKPLLIAAGLKKETIEAIPTRTGACRIAESLWIKERNSPRDAQKEWANRSLEAYELRNKLLHAFRYAFRNDEKLLARVSAIADGSGDADMIQDLSDLAVLGENNLRPLKSINFDETLLASAATSADELAVLLARANGEKELSSVAKITRDRAYTYMEEVVNEVKNCGRYVFWKNEARLKGYRNHYKNKHRKKSSNDDSAGTED